MILGLNPLYEAYMKSLRETIIKHLEGSALGWTHSTAKENNSTTKESIGTSAK
jgi:hypothetical protein